MARFRILRLLALRSLVAHKVSSTVIGGIIFFGTFLVVLGTSVLDSIDGAMAKSITSSLAGHLQVYSSDAQDDLALFGGTMMGDPELDRIPDFGKVRRAIEALPNVDAVIPMGMGMHTDVPQSELDVAIERLRTAVDAGDTTSRDALAQQIIAMAGDVEEEQIQTRAISANPEEIDEKIEVTRHVQSQAFWQELARRPQASMTYLDTKLAPLTEGGEMLWMRNLGTDLQRFAKYFDRFELVAGEIVPEGKRGLLLAERFYERRVKNLVARELDKLEQGVSEQGMSIDKDAELRSTAGRLPGQYRRVTFDLSPSDTQAVDTELRQLLPEHDGDFASLMQAFLRIDDSNVIDRHRQFYEVIAPRIHLYKVKVGDTLTLRSYTKSGYIKALNVPVYGVYRFKSLEKSELAGAQNLLDIVSFRELYGVMTSEMLEELREIREEVGVEVVARDNAEEALFGGSSEIESEAKATGGFDVAPLVAAAAAASDTTATDTFDPSQIDAGLAINAAVLLKDPTKLRETERTISALSEEKQLGIQVVDWQQASGLIGQLIVVIRIVLYVAISLIFLVALAIINNSMVMATLGRITEIGTMRALGAQRRFVMAVFFLETTMLGLLAGLGGAIAGAVGVALLGRIGIPAASDIMIFLFSGPRLHPDVGLSNILFALVVILLVSLVSTLTPARIAARIQPVVAMQARE